MEVEKLAKWKETNIGGTYFPLPWLWEEGCQPASYGLLVLTPKFIKISDSWSQKQAWKWSGFSPVFLVLLNRVVVTIPIPSIYAKITYILVDFDGRYKM